MKLKVHAIVMIVLILSGALVTGGLMMIAGPLRPGWLWALNVVFVGGVFAVALWKEVRVLAPGRRQAADPHAGDHEPKPES